MFAMQVRSQGGQGVLVPVDLPVPEPSVTQVRVRVLACGVCRTDLHILDGDLPLHQPAVVPGHEIVGQVVARGAQATRFALGARVGVPWLGASCGHCGYCHDGQENLCDTPVFTGYDRDGGFAEFAVAEQDFCFALPAAYDDLHAAPLLCAGLIGFRAYRMAGLDPARGAPSGQRLGLYGFGAAAHIACQIAVAHRHAVFAFTQAGDAAGQQFARQLGAVWAGSSQEAAPALLDAALIFAPVGALVPVALGAIRKGGVVVCAGIHMSDIPSFAYRLLWGERSLRSVANLTREDGEAFFDCVARYPVTTHVTPFLLKDANTAVAALRRGAIQGAAVLVP